MRFAPLLLLVLGGLLLSACGQGKIEVPKTAKREYSGAELFKQRCSGCHTFDVAGSRGSQTDVRTRERNDGPNFSVRCETPGRVLYAIRNGGFSGAIMPQNIVVGEDAQKVAAFVAKYSGKAAKSAPNPIEKKGNLGDNALNNAGGRGRGATPEKNQPVGGACGSKPGGGQSSLGG